MGIKKKYEYIAVSTPTAMLGSFFFFTYLYLNDIVSSQSVLTSPFLGGSFSLGLWFLNETGSAFNIKKPTFNLEKNTFTDWMLDYTEDEPKYDFVFRSYGKSHRLKCEIAEDRLHELCKICTNREASRLRGSIQDTGSRFRKLTKNQVWSANYLIKKRDFTYDEVHSCKTILWLTGQFLNWDSKGKAGCSSTLNPTSLVERAKRRWYLDLHKPKSTYWNLFKPSLVRARS